MIYQHEELATGGWERLSFVEKMAHIGSEVSRALNWLSKNNTAYSQRAAERALELVDLTLRGDKNFPRLKEISRLREAIVDYFFGVNQFKSTETSWRKYFLCFTYALRKNY